MNLAPGCYSFRHDGLQTLSETKRYISLKCFEIATWSEENRTIELATGLAPWMVVVMLGRELFVTSVRGVAESRGVAFGAKWSGKAKMILQSVTIPTVLTLIAVAPPGDAEWSAWTI